MAEEGQRQAEEGRKQAEERARAAEELMRQAEERARAATETVEGGDASDASVVGALRQQIARLEHEHEAALR